MNYPSKTLFVFQTSRNLQRFLFQNVDTFLHVSTLADFFDKVVLVPDKSAISKPSRAALLRKAAKAVPIERLGFSGNFLEFLADSDFLFSFFEELNSERKTIDDIRGEDVYAAFEDHLEVLEGLFLAYKNELEEVSAFDPAIICDYVINNDYIGNFEEIRIESMGLLTVFEIEVLESVSKRLPVKLLFTIDDYNKKMGKKFADFGVELPEETGKFEIDITAKTAKTINSGIKGRGEIQGYRLKNRIYEAPFALGKIADFLAKGYQPEKIAVILPDEGFSSVLSLFDRFDNLNFAFGEPLKDGRLYGAIRALVDFAFGGKIGAKLRMYGVEHLGGMFAELSYKDGVEPLRECVTALLEANIDAGAKYNAAKTVFLEELYLFASEEFAFSGLTSLEIAHLYLSSLSAKKIDDSRGGKIKVIGVLESRGLELDGAIVLDMNESYFPKKLDKDLFLNTKIKERSMIPTVEDRQNLQKHFLAELLVNTKESAFVFVENDEEAPSGFLTEIGAGFVDVDEEALDTASFGETNRLKTEPDIFVSDVSLYDGYISANKKNDISVSAFCDFLRCERYFFLKHVQKITKPTPAERDIALTVGSAIHKGLEELYKKPQTLFGLDKEGLKEIFTGFLERESAELLGSFELKKAIASMDSFFENEEGRIRDGYSVYAVEKGVSADIGGVLFSAKIDRIDKKNGEFVLLDYKITANELKADSKKTAEHSHKYQLALYREILVKNKIPPKESLYYDVLRGKTVAEEALEEKIGYLSGHISRFLAKPSFEETKEKKNCRFCDYAIICGFGADGAKSEEGEGDEEA